MGADINFFAGLGGALSGVDITGSGVGMYGSTFGSSVQVGQYQDSTFLTNSTGSLNGGALDQNKYQGNVSGVSNNGGAVIHINTLPLESGTVNVRFTNATNVKTQNGEARIFDRTTITEAASGVTTQVAQLVNGGSGVEPTTGTAQTWDVAEDGWQQLAGSGTVMTLLNSPGSGGLSPSGDNTEDTRHDFYLCLSASPDSIGSKTLYGLYIALEFL